MTLAAPDNWQPHSAAVPMPSLPNVTAFPLRPGRTDVPEWFEKLLARGFRLIKYEHKTKGPQGPAAVDWPKHYIDTPDVYEEGKNWGALLGVEIETGKLLFDRDFDWNLPRHVSGGLDCLFKELRLDTDFTFGRPSKPLSHLFFTSSQPVVSRKLELKGETLYESRGTKKDGTLGFQTMLPPSIHPEGEQLFTGDDGPIGHDPDPELHDTLIGLFLILAKSVESRQFKHDYRMALAGFLLKDCRLKEESAATLSRALATATDNDVDDATLTVKTTAVRVRNREKVKGRKALAAAIGDDVVAAMWEWAGGEDWILDKNNRPIANNEENIRRALARLGAKLTFDEFAQRMLIDYHSWRGELLDDGRTNRLWLDVDREFGFRPSKDFFEIVTSDIAVQNSFHPVRQYLDGLRWDGQPRMDEWLITYGKAKDHPYTRAVSSLVLIAAVRRVRQPGCKFDELLVLESDQGLLKSSALRALCPDEGWFSDDMPLNVDAKQIIERTLGKWIIEAAELAGMRSSQVESLKATLSRQVDGPVRMAYGRKATERPRQFINVGTTNSEEYLKDTTGNRRFWPLKVGIFNVDGIRLVRDQLWAEAAHREARGESIRLKPELYPVAAMQQESRRAIDPWEIKLNEHFSRDCHWRVTPDDVWNVLGVVIDRRDERGQDRVQKAMKKLQFRRVSVRVKDDEGKSTGKVVWGWAREVLEGQAELPDPGDE